jgi:hypothetical protein
LPRRRLLLAFGGLSRAVLFVFRLLPLAILRMFRLSLRSIGLMLG